MIRLVLFIFIVYYINCFGQQYSKSWKDLDYAGDAKVYHRLDIYLPKDEKPIHPVVVVIYGSAWFGNSLKGNDLNTLGQPLLDAGFAVVFPNHRSSTDAIFPAQINDIKAVVRFIRANAVQYQIDTSFIGITGSSSGGHLAALAGTSGMVRQFTAGSATMDIEGDIGAYLTYGSSVNAVVDWFGPTDFLVMDSCGSSLVHNSPNSPESSLVGGPIQENKDKCVLANPITYVDENDPPFLILHGDKDPLVPHCNSELLFDALQKVKVQSQFILVPIGQHGPGLFIDQYYKMMVDFFKKEAGITQADIDEDNTPISISMCQNYPNPFNPSTIIEYQLSENAFVNIKITDILGDEIETLVSEFQTPVNYNVQINASNLSSGVFLYGLDAG